MGLSDLAKRLMSGELSPDEKAVAESRRILSVGKKLLEAAPNWRNGSVDQAALSQALGELERALKNVDGRLVLGLLGGTGVGKSTLISALAGEPISTSSVIRPTTSLPVIYRHSSFSPVEGLEGKEVVHDISALRCLAIVDFPDFDSLETVHHQVVSAHLRDLDLVVWVTDYHKYADRRFYEVMHSARLGAMSQAALMNKCDELMARPDGYEALNYVMNSFAEHLREYGGWQGPIPWPVSAAEALAEPGNPTAGGLGPLRRLLDDLADEKYRRTVEMGNIEARNRDFLTSVAAAAPVNEWLSELDKIGRLKEDYQPRIPLEADLAVLTMQRSAYVAPRLDALKKNAKGLLALFTDVWDFVIQRFKGGTDAPPAVPQPMAPGFVHHLAGWSRELAALTSLKSSLNEEELLKESGSIIQTSLAGNFHDPKVGSWLLWLWPLAWAGLLIWAETGGVYTPSTVTAAALRSAAPWLIFALAGDIFLSRFTWFRVRRRYETGFHKAMDEASAQLMKMAEEHVINPANQYEEHLTRILDLTADLAGGEAASSQPDTEHAPTE
ncbi:hypothetical protein C4J81_11185 [Deltaproteobacteria bacterium Smac51]|nr:hypothetical protein C4J81_11185 [Deltaproteobacteria bacterium Smac51]